jgi:predicted nucleic acid-binding protein
MPAADAAGMYLVDTDVISEARKGEAANPGVRAFFAAASRDGVGIYLSVVTVGELRQGVERIRHRGDAAQARRLERWLGQVTARYADAILPIDDEIAQVWGRLRVPNAENPLDKQIAATALIHDLVVATRNVAHFAATGARVLNPFT